MSTQTANPLDVLSADLNDLADLPSFETPAPGSYILSITTSVKKINNNDAVEASCEVVEVVELADPSSKQVPAGTKFSVAFMLNNEFGIGNLKKFLAPFSAHLGITSISSLVEEIKEFRVAATVKNRKDKIDPDKVYASLDNITVA